jgi:mono/diheme cytochrome c family protein
MRHFLWSFVALLSALSACGGRAVPLPTLATSTVGDTAGLVERGQYIVRSVAVCGSCHTPDHKSDGPLVGGAEFRDWRLGRIRASNLTGDSATGLGAWSEAEIVRAIRNGQRRDGRLLAPVMPYEWFHGMSDRDAFAVARYLKTLAPVPHPVKQRPNLFFKIGRSLFLGPKRGTSMTAPRRAATAEYGAYLSQHLALCADCHTPTSGLRSKPDRGRLFAGQSDPPKDFPAKPSNLTPDSATGIATWTEEDFLRTLRTGVNPRGDSLHPFMPWRQVGRMSDEDLRAIYRYLRTVRPIHHQISRNSTN